MRIIRSCAIAASVVSSLMVSASAGMAASIPRNAVVTATPPGQAVIFSVYLPLQNKAALDALVADQQTAGSANYHKWLTPAQFNARFGPSPASLASAAGALRGQGFTVLGVSGRAIQLSGTAAMVSGAFGTSLSTVAVNGRSSLLAAKGLQLAPALKAVGASVTAFKAFPRMHTTLSTVIPSYNPANRYSPSGGYWYDDMKQAYDYPSYQSLDGTGANVAIVISSQVMASDVAAMFNHEKFTTTTNKAPPVPNQVAVDGGAPFDLAGGGAFESSLDVQQVLGGAPGANVTIVEIPDLSDDHIIDGYNYIVNAVNKADKAQYQLVNSSFGECELFYGAAYNNGEDLTPLLGVYNDIFEQGNSEGITFVASSGDSAGLGCPDVNYVAPFSPQAPTAAPRFLPGIEFPASSPYVTAVGGTNLLTTYAAPSLNSAYVGENGFGDPEIAYDPYGLGLNVYGGFWGAGGGVSAYFGKPAYQSIANPASRFRTTPDVGMQVGGCPGGISVMPCGPNRSYVLVYVGGSLYGLIGTSVSSPEFVGALALYVQKSGGGVGNVNPFLYAQGAAQTSGNGVFYNRNIPGFDGKYSGSTPSGSYNYITGNGTPKVRSLFGMTALPAAGAPQTSTNP